MSSDETSKAPEPREGAGAAAGDPAPSAGDGAPAESSGGAMVESAEAGSAAEGAEAAPAEGAEAAPAEGAGAAAAESAAAAEAAELSRREALRAKAQQVTAKQERRRMLTRVLLGVGALAVVAAAAFAITNAVMPEVTEETRVPAGFVDGGFTVDGRDLSSMLASSDPVPSPTPTPTPTPAEESDEAQTAAAAEPVHIRIYVDYLSAESGEFERANASRLARWVEGGHVSVTYHPVALLTSKSNGTKYSQRAVAAAACVATHAPDAFPAFNHALLVDQPDPDTEGFTDAQLAEIAVAAGAANPRNVRECIEMRPYASWARETTAAALDGELPGTEGVTLSGTPLVLVDGHAYVGSLDDPAEFTQFVLTVESDAYLSTPSPTPSPSE